MKCSEYTKGMMSNYMALFAQSYLNTDADSKHSKLYRAWNADALGGQQRAKPLVSKEK